MFDGAYPPGVEGWMLDLLEADVKECCGSCMHYNGTYCTKEWNNMDSDYCIPHRDEKDPEDNCDDWEGE